jgi:hypothetical protein
MTPAKARCLDMEPKMMHKILTTAACLAALTACHSSPEPTGGAWHAGGAGPTRPRAGSPVTPSARPYTPLPTTSSPVATAITPPPGAHHSSIADVFVPPNASLEPERWDLDGTGYSDAVAQEEALLPVGQPLDGYPWCQKTADPPGSTDNTSWIWGRPGDAIFVSVFPVTNNHSTIVVRRSNNAEGYCK